MSNKKNQLPRVILTSTPLLHHLCNRKLSILHTNAVVFDEQSIVLIPPQTAEISTEPVISGFQTLR